MASISIDIFSDIILRPAWWLSKNLVYYMFYGGYYLIAGKQKSPEEKQREQLSQMEKKIDNLMEIIQVLDPDKVQNIRDKQELRELGYEEINQYEINELEKLEEKQTI
jgi:hypothetical protein